MNNENTFTNNYRSAFPNQAIRNLMSKNNPLIPSQGVVETLRGDNTFTPIPNNQPKNPSDYGAQQNAIGLGALSALAAFLDPTILPALLAGALTISSKEGEDSPTIIVDPGRARKNFDNLNLQELPSLPSPDKINEKVRIELPAMDEPIKFMKGPRRRL